MSQRIGSHIRSNIVGYVAVFIALSGTAYAVDGPLAGQDTVGSEDIINGEVKGPELAPNVVGTGKIGNNQVFPEDVRDDTLPDGGLRSVDLAADSVGGSEIAGGAVGATEIAEGAVGNSEIAVNAITGSQVFPSSLTGADIQANSLSSADLAPDAAGSSEVAPSAVGASEVADGSLGTAEFAGSIPAVQATRGFGQGIPRLTFTPLNFSAERYDTAGMHSTNSNLSRFTAPVDGIYLASVQAAWEQSGSGIRTLDLVKNGEVVFAREDRQPSSASFDDPVFELNGMVRLEAGDFVEAEAFHSSGLGDDTLSILKFKEVSPVFSMIWLAPGP